MGVWVRTVQANLTWPIGSSLIASVPRGDTLIRVHFGWGFFATTSTTATYTSVANNLMAMGVVTTVGNGSESVPNARTQSSDQDPPTQRWVYLECRGPMIAAIDAAGELVAWRDSGNQEPVDTKGMVSAKSIAEGDTLNVWASWAGAGDWDSSGTAQLWYYASLLYQPSS